MKLGIISDTHDNMDRVKQAISIFNDEGVDMVLHAGDITSPFALIPFNEELRADYKGIFGNNDGDRLLITQRSGGRITPQPLKTELDGRKVVVIHEPYLLKEITASGMYDLVIYGHTHRAEIKREGKTLIINPGEAGHWLYGKATIAILETDTMEGRIINLD
ncbi:MAG: metallophosphoesterase [Nitrospirae bacterium]|nr:MAG: metallophosphoesterase [Nitrospirota bacterium]